jgi:hypothetical protein
VNKLQHIGERISWIRETVLAAGEISAGDLDLLTVVDDPGEVVRIITEAHAAGGVERDHPGANGY